MGAIIKRTLLSIKNKEILKCQSREVHLLNSSFRIEEK